MKLFAILSTFLWSFVVADEASEDRWGGCQATFTGASVETLEKIEIGKQTIVCFHIGNSKDWARGVDYIRLSFQPEADQYSRFHVPNCKFCFQRHAVTKRSRLTVSPAFLLYVFNFQHSTT